MNKIMNVPEAMIHELPEYNNELMIFGKIMMTVYKNNERVFGNMILPIVLFHIPFGQLLLIILIHNNKNLFTYKDIDKLLPLIHFKYDTDDIGKKLKDSHIEIILGDDEEIFIQFINELVINIIDGYMELSDNIIEEYNIDSTIPFEGLDLDDLRCENGINVIHSVIMRAIISSIFDSSRMNDYVEYERKLLPVSKYHLLYQEKYSIQNFEQIFEVKNGLSEDECCLYNEIISHTMFLHLVITLENIIRNIYSEKDTSNISKCIKSIKDIFSDYPYDESGYNRVQYTLNKLLRIYDGTEKCAYIINGNISTYLYKLFKNNNGT